MNSLIALLLLVTTLTTSAVNDPVQETGKRDRPTKLVHFDVGIRITGSGKLQVNIDKQLGGQVYVQLLSPKGQLYFTQTLYANEEVARLLLDLSHLSDNNYILKVSNGLEMITREVKISSVQPQPVVPTRSVTLQ